MKTDKMLTRYISFTKLISTIEQGLFIPKATLFEDELEGVLDCFGEKDDTVHVISRSEIRSCMEWVYINCWHKAQNECHAMWKIYGSSSEAVAIQTTKVDLSSAYLGSQTNMKAYFDDVEYKAPSLESLTNGKSVKTLGNTEFEVGDFKAVYAALFSFIKHTGYGFENETRLVVIDHNASISKKNPKAGLYLPVNISREMIRKVLIHPYAPDWFENLVKEVVQEKYEMQIEVKRSSLSECS